MMPAQNRKSFYLLIVLFISLNSVFGKAAPLCPQVEKGFAYNITRSKGVVIFYGKASGYTFNLYNKDGSVWKKISYNKNGINIPDLVQPYLENIDPFVMVFDCREIKGGF